MSDDHHMMELIGSVETAGILGVSRETVTRLVKAEKLHPIQKLPGQTGAFLFLAAEVERTATERAAVKAERAAKRAAAADERAERQAA